MATTSELDHFQQGVEHLTMEDYAAAIQSFTQAIEHGQLPGQAHNNLGMIYLRQGELEPAIEHLEQAIALDPKFYHPYMNLGSLRMAQGAVDQAEDYFVKALQLSPEVPELYHNLGTIYVWKKDLPRARAMFEKVCQIQADDSRAHLLLAIIYLQLGEYYPAMANVLIGLKIEPTLPDGYRILGECFARQGKPLQALHCFQRALDKDMSNVDIILRIALLFIELRQLGQAAPLLERAAALQPERAETREILGLLYYDQGLTDRAAEVFQRLLLAEPENEVALEFFQQVQPQMAPPATAPPEQAAE